MDEDERSDGGVVASSTPRSRERSGSGWHRGTDSNPTYLHQFCPLPAALGGESDERNERDHRELFFEFDGEGLPVLNRVPVLETWSDLAATAYRYSPLVVLGLAVVLAALPEFFEVGLAPLSELPVFDRDVDGLAANELVLVGFGLLWLVILWTFSRLVDDRPEGPPVAQFVVYYSGALLLVLATAYSVYLVVSGTHTESPSNVLYASAYVLLLYLGGPLIYDGMLRTYTLLETLPTNGHLSEEYAGAYRASLDDLKAATTSPKVVLIAVLFVAQFLFLYAQGNGPFNTGSPVTYVVVFLGNLLITVLAVQFVLLIRFLRRLFDDSMGDPTRERPTPVGGDDDLPLEVIPLSYRPDSLDSAGGFEDFGTFATRVNTILVLALAYLSYRLLVQGLRDPLVTENELLWMLSYWLPVFVYVVVLALWLYLSFWTIHKKMVREKRECIRREIEGNDDPRDNLEVIAAYEEAPEWPIGEQVLFSVVAIDIVSIGLSALGLGTSIVLSI
ncbi:hypothetical protein [Halomarina oriensis]|uniref:Uncharacterized protein n=1 Tax=Halomarina oriensis TaxID=671145 RepID=A0A6B0GS47_9EURY|nr:hypothetical protein [Halomarina oriensis]MWG36127.1 hypothetical protein [Halomarina oriensis]